MTAPNPPASLDFAYDASLYDLLAPFTEPIMTTSGSVYVGNYTNVVAAFNTSNVLVHNSLTNAFSLIDVTQDVPRVADTYTPTGYAVTIPTPSAGGPLIVVRMTKSGVQYLALFTTASGALNVTLVSTGALNDLFTPRVNNDGTKIVAAYEYFPGGYYRFKQYDTAGALEWTSPNGPPYDSNPWVYWWASPRADRILVRTTDTITLYNPSMQPLSSVSVTLDADRSPYVNTLGDGLVMDSYVTSTGNIAYRVLDCSTDGIVWLDALQTLDTDWRTTTSTARIMGLGTCVLIATSTTGGISAYWLDPVSGATRSSGDPVGSGETLAAASFDWGLFSDGGSLYLVKAVMPGMTLDWVAGAGPDRVIATYFTGEQYENGSLYRAALLDTSGDALALLDIQQIWSEPISSEAHAINDSGLSVAIRNVYQGGNFFEFVYLTCVNDLLDVRSTPIDTDPIYDTINTGYPEQWFLSQDGLALLYGSTYYRYHYPNPTTPGIDLWSWSVADGSLLWFQSVDFGMTDWYGIYGLVGAPTQDQALVYLIEDNTLVVGKIYLVDRNGIQNNVEFPAHTDLTNSYFWIGCGERTVAYVTGEDPFTSYVVGGFTTTDTEVISLGEEILLTPPEAEGAYDEAILSAWLGQLSVVPYGNAETEYTLFWVNLAERSVTANLVTRYDDSWHAASAGYTTTATFRGIGSGVGGYWPTVAVYKGIVIPPVTTQVLTFMRMAARDDGGGYTQPHARFQQNLNRSSAASTGHRIFGTGKNASEPPGPRTEINNNPQQ